MVWYSHPSKNFPQIVVIYIVKTFSIVIEAEIDVFLEFPCIIYDPMGTKRLQLVLPLKKMIKWEAHRITGHSNSETLLGK